VNQVYSREDRLRAQGNSMSRETSERLTCPSSQADVAGAVVFGIIGGSPEAPEVGYLAQAVGVSDEILALAGPVLPSEVFRIAGPCAAQACRHFDGQDCSLATKLVQLLPRAVDRLPACTVRSSCRWWAQEGAEACRRCPQVVTWMYHASDNCREAADPAKAAGSKRR
jgi:hypothetical protein